MLQPEQRAAFGVNAVLLVTASTLLQCLALFGVLPIIDGTVGHAIFASVEMLLIVLLVVNGWRIRRWSIVSAQTALVRSTATLCAVSLSICACGDLVNRNYFELQYSYDRVVRHSYLADSVWFFLPGYALLIAAVWRIAGRTLSTRFMLLTALIAASLGLLAFIDMRNPATGLYVTAMTGTYSIPITVTACSAIWLIRSLGWNRAYWPALGLILATLADALIGNFWLYRDGYYPAVSHLNWIIYFASQAMVQRLPLQLTVQASRLTQPVAGI
ncbi:MAG: hypothetical protein JWR16_114 [Nevskia sp.]|nr:hypothetical protein [Nevskia sp.]